MTQVALRVYNHEIEEMIEKGQSAQAATHCRHILKFYPKHIDTYRLLGKAYLEEHRFAEASDVLQRVLSAVPDDFISQIGMSIIREDEGNLDAAIWHMERAFEAQPSNSAVQDELRHLYARRDGVEPPRIRLTRGALVRMYARGDLYQQAIAEIRAALAEDPQRVDLEVILARMYFLSGQTVAATEVCTRLINKLPYCFEANRILAEILPGTSRANDAAVYLQHVNDMDPYLAFIPEPGARSLDVPDNAVAVDFMEYMPEEEAAAAQSPEWAQTAGVNWESEGEALPDWFSQLGPDQKDTDVNEIEPIPSEDEAPVDVDVDLSEGVIPNNEEEEDSNSIPDWMQSAGWEPTDEITPDVAKGFNLPDEEIEIGEVPAWLQSIAPVEGETADEESQKVAWLDSILPAAEGENEPSGEPESTEDTPPADDTGLIVNNAVETPVDSAPDSGSEQESTLPTLDAIPDWLVEAGLVSAAGEITEEKPSDSLPSEQDYSGIIEETTEVTDSAKVADTIDIPIGSDELNAENELESAELPDWLSDLADQTSVIPDQPLDDQLSPVDQDTHSFPTDSANSTNSDDAPQNLTSVEDIASSEQMDETMAWLESLAARQGADEETLLVDPSERSNDLPDWIKEIETSTEDQNVADFTTAPGPDQGLENTIDSDNLAEEITDTGNFIENEIETVPVLDEETAHKEPLQPIPQDFTDGENNEEISPAGSPTADQIDEASPEEQPFRSTLETASRNLDSDDEALSWLEGLATDQGASEDAHIPEETLTDEIASVAAESQRSLEDTAPIHLPDWLVESEKGETENQSYETEDFKSVPDWLKDLENNENTAVEAPAVSSDNNQTHQLVPPEEEEERPSAPLEPGMEPYFRSNETFDFDETPPAWLKGLEEQSTGLVADTNQEKPDSDNDVWLTNYPTPPGADKMPETATPSEWKPEFNQGEISSETPPVENGPSDPYALLKNARAALEAYNIERALESYTRLIQNGNHLEDAIHDLRDALYRYPIDISIWQALGDAYMRSNRLQEALDAYTKAEELLR